MTTEGPWPGDWLRGALGVCVLRALADGPTYGYAITAQLADAGLGTVKGGTLYPLLSRLEAAGLVTVEWRAGERGPGRKYYRLTAAGVEELRAGAARWVTFAELTRDFVRDGPARPVVRPSTTGEAHP